MYIDEKMEPCFLVTPKGPIAIPGNSLHINDTDKQSLVETIPGLKDLFKVDISKQPFNKLAGALYATKTSAEVLEFIYFGAQNVYYGKNIHTS